MKGTNDFYKELIQNAPCGYAYCHTTFNSEGEPVSHKFLEVNLCFSQLIGLDESYIVGRTTKDIFSTMGEDWEAFFNDVSSKNNKTGKKYLKELEQCYEVIAFSPKHGYMMVMFYVITDEMKTIEKYNNLLLATNDIIIEFDENYYITDICTSDEKKMFIPKEKLLNKKIIDLMDQAYIPLYYKALDEARITEKAVEIEYARDNQWHRAEIISMRDINNKIYYLAAIYDISKQKKAELELIKKTRELEKVFKILPGFLCICNTQGKILWANNAVEKMTGFSKKDLQHKHIYDLLHPDDIQHMKNEMTKTEHSHFINRYICKEGLYHYVSWNCYFDRDEGCIYAIANDISKLKAYETELLSQKKFLRTLIDTIPDYIYYKDTDGIYLGCNKATAEEVFNTHEENIIGKTDKELFKDEEIVDIIASQDKEVLTLEKIVTYEEKIRLDNKEFVMETMKTLFYDENGNISGIIGVSRDITTRKNTERKIKESEERFRQLADNIDEAFWLSTDDKMLYISPGYERIWGRSCMHVYDDLKNFRKYIYDEDQERIFSIFEKEEYNVEGYFNEKYRIVKPDGTLRWVWERSFPIRDENGNIVRRAGIAEDITTLKIAEEVVARTREEMIRVELKKKSMELEQLAELDKLRTDFFANLSHELRTPINLIFAALKMIEIDDGNTIEQKNVSSKKYLKIIKQNSYRLMRLINNLIDVTRLDAGFLTLNSSNWDIVDIVKSVTLSVAEYAKNKEITLNFCSDIESLMTACDADKIERIMLNLLSNAIKYNNQGGEVGVYMSSNENEVHITISDNGIGIPVDKLEMIFERFKQVDSRLTKEGEGSGIGLSLVKSLVEMHGGTISVESTFGIGTNFYIILPIRLIEEDEDDTWKEYEQEDRDSSAIERIKMEFSDIYGLKI